MKENKSNMFKNKTTQQLRTYLKLLKITSIALITVLTFLIGISIYGFMTKENKAPFIASFAIVMSCGIILLSEFVIMNQIKNELNVRKENN
jgi:membrane protein YdbS with pleckstrin-like domain|tara:strand:+ start:3391 stop:3663 length:273 start_codon:yes stop_codon:yes gene_type:complete